MVSPQSLANLIPAKPGECRNPGGRPKGFGAYIRDKTKDGQLLVDDALKVLANGKSSDNARSAARSFLAGYGFGKPIETQEITATVKSLEIADALAPYLDVSRKEELAQLLGTLRANAGRN